MSERTDEESAPHTRVKVNVRGRGHGIKASWLTMWLFTIGIAKLGFGAGVVALVAWPYYLGEAIAALVR